MRGGTTTGADFREAARHEHELNDRQREVLALVASGLTNAEIGERLGMTLDGAKWNVSEILTMLGLASREEAAEYWRWHHGGVWSRVRGWLGAPLLKIAGAGAAVVLGVGVVAALSSEDEPPEPLVAQWILEGTFYARREMAAWQLEPPEDADRGTVRWVRVDESHWRLESHYQTDREGTGDSLIVADGEFLHFYEGANRWHYRIPIDWMPPGWLEGLGSGGASFRALTGSIDDYIDAGKDATGHPDWHKPDAWRAGTDVVLGLPVEVIDTTPSWSNGEFHSSGGITRHWIEPGHLLILKTTSEGNDGSVQRASEVTSLRFDIEVAENEFRFRPPEGSCDMGEGTPGRPDDQIPHGVDADQWRREQRCGS